MSGSGQEALLDVREWSSGPPGCPGVVERPYRTSRSGVSLSQMSEKPSRMSRSGRDSFPDVLEWSGSPPGCLGVV